MSLAPETGNLTAGFIPQDFVHDAYCACAGCAGTGQVDPGVTGDGALSADYVLASTGKWVPTQTRGTTGNVVT